MCLGIGARLQLLPREFRMLWEFSPLVHLLRHLLVALTGFVVHSTATSFPSSFARLLSTGKPVMRGIPVSYYRCKQNILEDLHNGLQDETNALHFHTYVHTYYRQLRTYQAPKSI